MHPRQFLFLAILPMALAAQEARDMAPLKNWSAPLYFQPNRAETDAAAKPVPQLQFSATQVSPNALSLVAIAPCRLLDTRGTTTGFSSGAPYNVPLATAGTLTIPVQTDASNAACGTIPSIAQAYSFNVTVIPVAAGPVGYLTIWPAGTTQPVVSTMNDREGVVIANAAIVPAGTPNGGISVYNSGPAAANVIIDINGFFAAPTDLNFNTAMGAGALASDTTGNKNTASGQYALNLNTTGNANLADGFNALGANTTGNNNTASGANTLQHNTTGSQNTAIGQDALFFNTIGDNNTATGAGALASNTTACCNTATGTGALNNNSTGTNNVASGQSALLNNTAGNNNTAIGQAALFTNTAGNNNTASGQNAMFNNTTGCCNTASGQAALFNNTTANANSAFGGSALQNNTTGNNNAAFGQAALMSNTTGNNNTASGQNAMQNNNTGCCNTASGQAALHANTTGNGSAAFGGSALQDNTTGGGNSAFGQGALVNNTTGSSNIALGQAAGQNAPVGNNNSIYIGSVGSGADVNGTIQIGTQGTQTGGTFIAGVSGATSSGGVAVFVNSNGRLGTVTSSRRFKEQISEMGNASSKLLQLRPVTFYYKPEYDDGSHLLQYGLIAEEVAKVYPEMVVYDKNGEIQTVKYQLLAPMLLNEVQKQSQHAEQQDETIRQLQARLAALEALLGGVPTAATSGR